MTKNAHGSTLRFEDLLKEWLEKRVSVLCRQRTCIRYRDIAEKHLISSIGGCEVNRLNSKIISDLLASKCRNGNLKTGGGLSGATVNMIRTVLKLAMQYARDNGYIKENPVLSVSRARSKPRAVTAFTVQEQRLIEKEICESGDARLLGVRICLYTGLRLGELLALRWSDIDFRSGLLHVNKTVYQVKNEKGWGTVTDRPKSDASERYIPIPTMLLKELRTVYRGSKSENIICDKHGNAVKIRTYQGIFKRLLRESGIRGLNFHALRHTFATRALETKMDIKTLSELLGHESAAVTIKIYCHSLMSTKRKAINQLNKYYFTASNKIFGANFQPENDRRERKNTASDFIHSY